MDSKGYKFGCVFQTKDNMLGIQYEDVKRRRTITCWPIFVAEHEDDGQVGGWQLATSCSFADKCPESLSDFMRDKWHGHVQLAPGREAGFVFVRNPVQ